MTRTSFDQIPVGIFGVDREFVVRLWNRCMAEWLALPASRIEGRELGSVLPAFRSAAYRERISQLFDGGPPVVLSPHLHQKLFSREGEEPPQRRLLTTASHANLAEGTEVALFAVQDVSGELERARLLREMHDAKATLLREHHHRTKNNFMMLTSLVELQKEALHDPRDSAVLEVFQSRIMSIQRVHEHLYSRDSFDLQLDLYIRDLVADVIASGTYGGADGAPRVEMSVEPLRLQMNDAIPMGMILAELITNSLKYAVRGADDFISVEAGEDGNGAVTLVYRDSGEGRMDTDSDSPGPAGLGTELNEAFAAQLGGSLRVDPGPGTVSTLTFPLHAD